MQSCNGGTQIWELNRWYEATGELKLCKSGYHLTYYPELWKGTRVFLAEATEIGQIDTDKFVCRKIQLLKELSAVETAVFVKSRTELKRKCSKVGFDFEVINHQLLLTEKGKDFNNDMQEILRKFLPHKLWSR